ncbi:MAG: phosphotransferase [Acidobacteriota bacterium]
MQLPDALEFSAPALHVWLTEHGFPAERLIPLGGDVSPRRYVRALSKNAGSAILAQYPAEVRPQAERFLRTSGLLEQAAIRVPNILASDVANGLMLLEDLGSETLYEKAFGDHERRIWFERAGEILLKLRRIEPMALVALNPPLDGALLGRELEQTWELFLLPCGLEQDPPLATDLRTAFEQICVALDEEARVPCHRDYMARNLVPLADDTLAVIDHQDLRLGPPGYDWASLLNDSLFAPPQTESSLLEIASALEVAPGSYRRAAVQRGFKAIGTFRAFAGRGSDRHLPLIAPTLARALDHLGSLPEGVGLAGALRRHFERRDLLH